jgi:uncharacterized protein (DUF885 family)
LNPILPLAAAYLDDMVKTLPVISASDEFYFFPRASRGQIDHIEGMDVDELSDLIRRLEGFLTQISGMDRKRLDREERIDLVLLAGSIRGVLRELRDYPIWRRDPTFFLTILMEAVTRFSFETEMGISGEGLLQLIVDGTTLIENGMRSLKMKGPVPPELSLDTARKMARDCIDFIGGAFCEEAKSRGASGEVERKIGKLIASLEGFRDCLLGIRGGDTFSPGRSYLSGVLADSYGMERDIPEVLDIGQAFYRENRDSLVRLGKRLSNDGWRSAYSHYTPPRFIPSDLMGMYRAEARRIQEFLEETGDFDPSWARELEIAEVPPFLRSVRSAAAYTAPAPGKDEGGTFFIIPTVGDGGDDGILSSHREFIFMTAHETYPGHHLLDSVRIGLENPLRSSVESPLFYEGWACYGETLLLESGYERDEHLALQLLRRDAWRGVRLLIDIGFNSGSMDIDDAAALLHEIGRPKVRAQREARRIALTPGYQLSYCLGKSEFLNLEKIYGGRMAKRTFYETILFGGEIPFHFISERLAAIREKDEE